MKKITDERAGGNTPDEPRPSADQRAHDVEPTPITWHPPSRKNGKWTLERERPAFCDKLNPEAADDRERVAAALKLTPEEILQSYREQLADDEPAEVSMFAVRLRGMKQKSDAAQVIPGVTPGAALKGALQVADLPDEAVVEWDGLDKLCALDLDAHGDLQKLALREDEDIVCFFPDRLPKPVAAWRTHSGGMRAIFEAVDGFTAIALAGIWYLLVHLGRLAGMTVEALSRTRHPNSLRDGKRAGPVLLMNPTGVIIVPRDSGEIRVPGEEEIAAWLDNHGMRMNGRYPHTHCPINPTDQLENPSVVVNVEGIRCYKCGSRSWGQILDGGVSTGETGRPSLYDAAREFVHLPHQSYVIRDMRPQMPEDLIGPVWRAMLFAVNQPMNKQRERLVQSAGSPRAPDVVRRAGGGWLDAATLEPRNITSQTAREFSWTTGSGTRIDAALDSQPLRGFMPLLPIPSALVIAPNADLSSGMPAIIVRKPQPAEAPPRVDVGSTPPSREEVEEAWQELEKIYPGIDRGYITGLVAGTLRAQTPSGQPPIIVVKGFTGAAKSTTARLNAAMLGCQFAEARLADAITTQRWLGLALERGPGIAVCDEIGRAEDAFHAIGVILALSGTDMTFEAKYSNPRRAPLTSSILLCGSSIPASVACSPELARRAAAYNLRNVTPPDGDEGDWKRHGDIMLARHDEQRRRALDTITTSIWWMMYEAGPEFDWRTYCYEHTGAVPLRELAEGGAEEVETRNGAIRDLYAMWRGADQAALLTNGHWKPRTDYLDCSPGAPGCDLFGELVQLDAKGNVLAAQMHDAGQTDLTPIIPEVVRNIGRVTMSIHKHGQQLGIKFMPAEGRRGALHRQQFPPLDDGLTTVDQVCP